MQVTNRSFEVLERRNMLSAAGVAPRLPDLIPWVDSDRGYLSGWTVDEDELQDRVLLRLSATTANIGEGPLELRGGDLVSSESQEVHQRIYQSDGTFIDRLAGTFEYHSSHGHLHFEGYAEYQLRAVLPGNQVGEVVATGGKTSFCLIDVAPYDRLMLGVPDAPVYTGCRGERQGLSVGWADLYESGLPDQWIDVTDVPNGQYWLQITVDPDNQIVELDETNNTSQILIDFDQPASIATDRYEPNNSSSDAVDLAADESFTIEELTISTPGDEDWFIFWRNAPRAGRMTVTSEVVSGDGDLNMILYEFPPFHEVASGISIGSIEQVQTAISAGVGYGIRVIETSGNTVANYSLSVSIEDILPSPNADTQEPNDTRVTRLSGNHLQLTDLNIDTSLDQDNFRWLAPRSDQLERVNVRIDFPSQQGNLDLLIYDGRRVLTGLSLSGIDHESVTVDAQSLRYIRVVGRSEATVPYNLRLDNHLVGDATGDDQVNISDFLALSENYGSIDAAWADGDFDGNGRVDFSDFLDLSANFGASRSS